MEEVESAGVKVESRTQVAAMPWRGTGQAGRGKREDDYDHPLGSFNVHLSTAAVSAGRAGDGKEGP
jgi:hypothetical protein